MANDSLFTLDDLALQVGKNIGDQSDLTLADCKKWINRSLLMFSEMGEWSFQRVYGESFSTVANTATAEVANVIRIDSMYTATPLQRKLTLIEDRLFRIRFPNATATGTPYYWRIAGRKKADTDTQIVGLYPIPDAVYTINWDGVRKIPLLVNDSDDIRTVTGMPTQYVNLVIEIATALGYKGDDDALAAQQLQECAQRLQNFYFKDQDQIDDRLIMRPMDADSMSDWYDPILPSQYGP